MDRDREFGEFVDARALVMRRTAYLLCGDWHRAEDIVQQALIKMYVAWSRVRKDSVDAYARKVLVRTAIDETRRGFFQRERIVDAVPESAVTDATTDLDLRRALGALPAGQRAVVVLRYWEDLSITETARILGRTEGTVKSQAAKGLAALRDLLENEPASRIYTSEVIRRGRTKLVRRRTAIAGAMVFTLLAGAGVTGYLAAMPHEASAPATSQDAGGVVDRNAELTKVLRRQYALPAGVTAEDVPEIRAGAFVFFTRDTNTPDNKRRAVARLRDAQGVGGVTIAIGRATSPDPGNCDDPSCRIEERDGIRIRSIQLPSTTPGAQVVYVDAIRPDGTSIMLSSDNIGRFSNGVWGDPDIGGAPQRSAPLLDREELIKIATLPGLTF
ncbi:RNA polymerase sigma-70 factor (sigma-E family) [Lentzea flaviverrucosa]|uniref:RNA polymerase sigma-70 factor, sigma-E family n=1 Tax=Lentzea flaviverrucosa TaxID=200379 RepID=A0A1H9PKP1_9PSEU|nr:RNA polymerase sigma-70 factor (sigma-E family) [Lentzea flaviverrucosa]SER48379.1 RNA polymerase sigma-70 factor, sigma-E family [Lentzea flaviverrucosa]